MGQLLKLLSNLILGVSFALMLSSLTFGTKEFVQYAGLILGIGVAFTIGKLNTEEINKLKKEIDKLKKNNE